MYNRIYSNEKLYDGHLSGNHDHDAGQAYDAIHHDDGSYLHDGNGCDDNYRWNHDDEKGCHNEADGVDYAYVHKA